jgi:hypothetical protein
MQHMWENFVVVKNKSISTSEPPEHEEIFMECRVYIWLWHDSWNSEEWNEQKSPLLGNFEVNTFSRQQILKEQYRDRFCYVVRAEGRLAASLILHC